MRRRQLRRAEGCWTLQLFEVGALPVGTGDFGARICGVKPQKVALLPCEILSRAPSVMGVFICCLRILHIYAAKGLRAHTLAAAERMKALRRLDAKEHRGKVKSLGWEQPWSDWHRDIPKNPALPLCSCKDGLGDTPCSRAGL